MKLRHLTAFLFLAACGFQPIYGDMSHNTATASVLNNVAIANIPDREGQELRNHLIDRMYTNGRPVNPILRLEIGLKSNETDLGLQKDATTTRAEHNLTADFVLRDMEGTALFSGTARSIVAYNKLSAQYGTVVAKESAADRSLIEVGEQIVNRIALFIAENPQKFPTQKTTAVPPPPPATATRSN